MERVANTKNGSVTQVNYLQEAAAAAADALPYLDRVPRSCFLLLLNFFFISLHSTAKVSCLQSSRVVLCHVAVTLN